jgi:hypothetical protein
MIEGTHGIYLKMKSHRLDRTSAFKDGTYGGGGGLDILLLLLPLSFLTALGSPLGNSEFL